MIRSMYRDRATALTGKQCNRARCGRERADISDDRANKKADLEAPSRLWGLSIDLEQGGQSLRGQTTISRNYRTIPVNSSSNWSVTVTVRAFAEKPRWAIISWVNS